LRYLVLDFETTNLDKGDALNPNNHIVLACWYQSWDNTMHRVRASELQQRELVQALTDCEFIVAHNAKFELQWLARCGANTVNIGVFDTMLAEYVLAGNRRRGLSLDACADRYSLGHKGSLVARLIDSGVCPSDIPGNLLEEYCVNDVMLCWRLFQIQDEILRLNDLGHIARNRFDTCKALADIEMNGVQLDVKSIEEEYPRAEAEFTRLQDALNVNSGGLNWDSPKQVGSYLYDVLGFPEPTSRDGKADRTAAGGRRTDESTVLSLKGSTPRQRDFLGTYKAFAPYKLLLRTWTKLRACGLEGGGKLYGTYNQAVTQTHRLSSSGKKYKIQFQNFDRSLKRLIVPSDPDYYIMEADAMQLEFRVAGHLGRDSKINEDVRNHEDIHRYTASVLYGVSEHEVTSEQRTNAKPSTFKPLYGGMSGTDAEVAYYEAFRKKYHQTYQTQKKWTYQVLAEGKLRTEFGMLYYWPDTKISKSGYISNTPSIFNYPVQGSATAEMIPITLCWIWTALKHAGLRSRIINTVHDSVVLEVHKDELKEVADIVKEAFTRGLFHALRNDYGVDFTIPLGCEIKVGTFWGDSCLMSEKFEMTPEEAFKHG